MDDIERIRRQQEPRLTDEEYQRMLKLLSDGQNTNVSRFLYELLQNADDAHYGPKTPQVIIRYSDRYVLFESNEVGFSKANLNSICRATMSTKRGDENARDQRRSIGEKGIGFKSVFMVATSVWINSGFYAFRFDADTPLGRVRPIWDEDWPSRLTKSKGFTSILLMLPDNKRPPTDMKIVDPTEVIRGMKELDPMDLIFLSRLKNVHIQLVDDNGFAKKILGPTRWQTTLKVDAIPETVNLLMDMETHRDGIRELCVVFRYPVAGLPPSSDRPNLTTSELILVFSRDMGVSSGKLIFSSRRMYAFLPIRDYGFKFTIHSDFILVSNREDMEPVQWNREIVRRIPHALAEAVEQFKGKYPDLWVKWPLLLPLNGLSGDIFRSIPEGIKTAFSLRNVLEDANGLCVRPHEVRIVPKHLRDRHGTPFLPHSCSKMHVLSEKYSEEARDKLIELGVEYLSHEAFLQDLSVFILNHHTEFVQKSDPWHDELCKLLSDLLDTYKYRKVIESLELVPLSKTLPNGDHEWVSPKAGKLYFPVETRGLRLPPCIEGCKE
ncbi:unnamed protein product [Clonostachys solani]|uniref:ATP-binding protein n=1 Tax=Clonostachys solani TaxID=160281 RepID=A0A9N9W591_9HYPO|nr:unnamed protein product [Clonostachys solani]